MEPVIINATTTGVVGVFDPSENNIPGVFPATDVVPHYPFSSPPDLLTPEHIGLLTFESSSTNPPSQTFRIPLLMGTTTTGYIVGECNQQLTQAAKEALRECAVGVSVGLKIELERGESSSRVLGNVRELVKGIKQDLHKVKSPLSAIRGNVGDVVAELVYNGIRHGSNSGLGGKVKVRSYEDETGVVVVVWSEGEVEDGVKEKMMEEGFTTRRDGQGLGLGIVKEELDKAGAEINIENIDGGLEIKTTWRRYQQSQ
ncbi:hypothetical protein TrRE_jg12038 [Triparma retinervis]|uniref:Histidine kinase domain-containing protein n=1 Tax=Triparma retinervis TaxID=2557542 RepID=A0A9W6ZGI3_9STRA|nr:hypothetical protein TrRE_jg12038 [Triparma retinervis]